MNATLAALTSQLDSLKINLKFWEDELSRGEKLYQAKALTQSALDNMRNRKAEAASRLSSLMAQIQAQKAQISSVQSQQKAAEKDVQVWRVRRDYAEVIAPVDCTISARLQEEGNRVVPGTSIYNVEDVSSSRLLMQVPQESARLIKTGQKIVFQNGENSGFLVSRIFPVHNELRQVTIEAAKIGDLNGLVLDMLIPVRIVVEEAEGLIIPQEARFVDFIDQQRFYVYTIKNNLASRLSLKPLLCGDTGITVVDAGALNQHTTLAVGPYLENVRLPASFAVEVIK
jgi:multidrug efflux pump subunit AcrA (membrane-fusion protein)